MRDSMWLVEIVPRNQAYSESRAVNELLMGDRFVFTGVRGEGPIGPLEIDVQPTIIHLPHHSQSR
jgi:hypothetical protein